MGKFVDLSHRLEPGMPSYPGLREARFGAVMTHESSSDHYQGKANFFLGEVDMPTNIGTYLDAPFHRYPERRDLAGIGIEELCDTRRSSWITIRIRVAR
jgi:kynurenine formamidase